MATELHEVEGIANWAKVFEFNRDMNTDFHGEDGAYTIEVTLEKAELDKHTKSGSRVKPKLTDEGVSIRYKRKHTHQQGIEELGGPPKVVDKDKQLFPENTLIGNGSRVKVYFSVYETKKGKGTRLEGIQVLDLVEFESEDYEGGGGGVKLPF